MITSNFYTKQAKKHNTFRTGFIGTAILTVLWVVLSLFAIPCTGVEAAPSREDICGVYSIIAKCYDKEGQLMATGQGTMTIRLRGNNYTVSYGGEDLSEYRHRSFNYNPVTGRAEVTFYNDRVTEGPYGPGVDTAVLNFSGSGNNITLTGTDGLFRLSGRRIRAIAAEPGAPVDKPQSKQSDPQKNQNPAKPGANQQKDTTAKSNRDTGDDYAGPVSRNSGDQSDDYDRDREDLPASDIGKVGAAVGTAVGGGLIGLGAGAIGGGAGGAAGGAGGAGGAAGSAGGGFSGYGPEEGGYGPREGGYGPEEGGYGPEEGGYGPEEGGYGPEEGGYGPDEGFGDGDGSGGDFDDSGEDQDESDEDFDDSGEDQDESDEDFDDSGEDQDESDEDFDDSGEDQDESDEDQNESDEDQNESDEDQDESDEDQDESDEDQDESDNDNDDNRDDFDDSREDFDDNRNDFDDNRNDFDDSRNDFDDSRNDFDDSRNDFDDSRNDFDDSRNDFDDNYDRAGDDSDKNDYEDAGRNQDDSGDDYNDYQDADNGQGDGTEAEDQTDPSEDTQGEPAADNMTMDTPPDNMTVDENGNIHVTTPDGEKMVFPRNEDGTFKIPSKTEEGTNVADSDWNGTATKEDVQYIAQWYKDNEDAMRAERAAEDARRQAERDLQAADNARWRAEQREIDNQKSWLTRELEEQKKREEFEYKHWEYIEKKREEFAHGDESLSVEQLKRIVKKARLKKNQAIDMIEGGEAEQEAAMWDNRLVTAQEVKFVADQAVNAYGMLSGNQSFSNAYSALTNYTETLTDAYRNNKSMGKAFFKATVDTGLDVFSNKLESHGWNMTGNAFSNAYKQVNDNLYNGRDAFEGTDKAAALGGLMGGAAHVSKYLGKKSQGTVFGREVGLDGFKPVLKPDVDVNSTKLKTDFDSDTNGIRETNIAERRMGEGLTKSKLNTDGDVPNTKLNTDGETGGIGRQNATDVQSGKTNLGQEPEVAKQGMNAGEPTGRTNAGEPTGRTNAGEPTGRTNAGEPTGRTNAGEPTGRTNAGEPTGRTNAGEPTGRTNAGEPTGRTNAGEPTGRTNAGEPTGRTNAGEPTGRTNGDATGKPNGDATGRPNGDATGKPNGDATGRPNGDATGKPNGDATGRPNGDATGKPNGDATGKPNGDATGKPNGDATGRPNGDATGKPNGDATGRPNGDATGKPNGDATGRPNGDATGRPNGDATGRPNGDATGKPNGDATGRPNGDATGRPNGDATGKPNGDATGRTNGDATGKPNGDATGRPNGDATGRPNGDATGKPNGDATGRPNGDATGRPNGDATGKPNGDATGKPNGDATGKPNGDATGRPNGDATGKPNGDATTGSSNKPKTGGTESKNQSSASSAEANEDWQGTVAMNKVRKLHKISQKLDAMEKANPKTYQNDPEYQKLSQEFDVQAREVRENKLSVDRMNALQGKTGTDLRKRYNKSDIEYEKKVLEYRNESIAEEYGLKTDQIGDYNVTSNKIAEKLSGGKASHDTDTSPYVKVNTGTGKNAKVDFTQVDGDHHLARAIYKAEHGRYPQTAAEYDEALRLKELRDFTNVSTRPSDTHELHHNPDAYVGSGKGDVNKVLHPEKYGTPEKGTGILNKQTAIHKQELSLNRHHEQYAEAQQLRQKLNTDKTLSAAEKTAMGKKIADLESQSASNHYESVRTTAKEFNIIKNINDVNIKNGLGDGLSKEAKQIGRWANQVAEGRLEVETYKQLVTKLCGSEENALKIVADGFRTTNK